MLQDMSLIKSIYRLLTFAIGTLVPLACITALFAHTPRANMGDANATRAINKVDVMTLAQRLEAITMALSGHQRGPAVRDYLEELAEAKTVVTIKVDGSWNKQEFKDVNDKIKAQSEVIWTAVEKDMIERGARRQVEVLHGQLGVSEREIKDVEDGRTACMDALLAKGKKGNGDTCRELDFYGPKPDAEHPERGIESTPEGFSTLL